jgi:hypothetical protein
MSVLIRERMVNMEMSAYEGVVQPDDIPPSDGAAATEEVRASIKEKRR